MSIDSQARQDTAPRPTRRCTRWRPALVGPLAAALVVFGLAGCSDRVKDTHPQQWVSQRQAVFKDFTRTLEPMGLMARERQAFDADAFKASALRLQELSTKPWPLFTADSNYAPTLARPQVWEQPDDFRRAQEAFVASVAQLVQATQPGTLAAARPAVEDVQQRCKDCHDKFRSR
jgi:cytochrome c556